MQIRYADLSQATRGCVLRPRQEQIAHMQQHFVLRVLHGADNDAALLPLCDLAKMQETCRDLHTDF